MKVISRNEILCKNLIDLDKAVISKSVVFRCISKGGNFPTAPFSFLSGSVPIILMKEVMEKTFIDNIGIYEIKNSHIFYDGIIIGNNDIFFSDKLNINRDHCSQVINWILSKREIINEIKIDGTVCPLYGPGWPTWGHWLVEFLPRIFLLKLSGYNIYEIKFVLPVQTPKFALDLISKLGITNLLFFNHEKEIILAEKILITNNMSSFGSFHPLFFDYVNWLNSSIKVENNTQEIKKIYLMRTTNNPLRILTNRSSIEEIARNHGYTMLDPNVMSIDDQINAFRYATHIVGEYGSSLHSSIFCLGSPFVTAIRGSDIDPGFIQNGICQVLNQRIGYIFGDMDYSVGKGSFYINESLFKVSLNYADLF